MPRSARRGLAIAVAALCALALSAPARAVVVTHSGNVAANTTWSAADVHRITGTVTVLPGVTLTIEAGAVVKLDTTRSLIVNGALSAVGTPAARIVFTSYRDDAVAGDSNGDGSSTPAAGDWASLLFGAGATVADTHVEYVDLRYGGVTNAAVVVDGSNVALQSLRVWDSKTDGILVTQASAQILTSEVLRSAQAGIRLRPNGGSTGSSALVQGNHLANNADGLIVESNSYPDISPEIRDNEIADNAGWGLSFEGSNTFSPPITGNVIHGNHRPAQLPLSAVPSPADGNVFGPNAISALWIHGGYATEDLSLSSFSGPDYELHTYVVQGRLWMGEGHTLAIVPGVVAKFTYSVDYGAYGGLAVDGVLLAQGTAAQPVVLTSLSDDSFGGDTGEDGPTVPTNREWEGVLFFPLAPSGQSLIDHAVIRHGDYGVSAEGTGVTVRNSELSYAAFAGFFGTGGNHILENNEVFANFSANSPADSGDGYVLAGGTSTIHGGRVYANGEHGIVFSVAAEARVEDVELFANTGAALFSESEFDIDARGCWWGAADGPGGGGGFTGSGDEVQVTATGAVVVSDVLQGVRTSGTRSSYFDAGPNLSQGTLAPPTVLAGVADSSFGVTPASTVLYDPNAVRLRYDGLDPAARYRVVVSYANQDNTDSAGGNVQRLTAAPGALPIHDSLYVSYAPFSAAFAVPPAANATGSLELDFVRELGYRAVVSSVVLVEEPAAETDAPSATLLSPAPGARLNAPIIAVSGGANDVAGGEVAQVEIGIDAGAGIQWRPVTQFSVSAHAWSYLWGITFFPPPEGSYTLYARAIDAAGNRGAPSAGVSVTIDRTAPAPISELTAYDSPADAGGRIDLGWQRSADDGAGANDVVRYDVERAPGVNGPFALIGTAAAGATSFSDSSAVNGTLYHYRVFAVDAAGNRSAALVYGPARAIVNAGGDVTAPANVTALQVFPGNGLVQVKWTFSTDTAGDLVEHWVDYTIDGGAHFSAPVHVPKSVNSVVLDGLTNNVIHRIRVRVVDSATPQNISSGVLSGNVTPSATAVRTVAAGTLPTVERWPRGTYSVTGLLTVPAGGVLQIDPGAIVKFANTMGITVNGRLQALGTAALPISFTSISDDTIGGDTNGNGGATVPVRGAWRDITVAQNASATFDYALIRYAGSGTFGNVRSDRGSLEIRHGTIRDSSTSGVQATSGTLIVEDSLIENHNANAVTVGFAGSVGSHAIRRSTLRGSVNGIQSTGHPVEIAGNTITGNSGYGVFFASDVETPELRDNSISGNARLMRVPPSGVPGAGSGNSLAGNTRDTVEINGFGLVRDLTLPSGGISAYWLVTGSLTQYGGFRLNLGPGTVFKFGPNGAFVSYGLVSALGTAAQPVVFTGQADDAAGGDSNADGPSQARAGDWYGVTLIGAIPPGLTRIEHAEFRFAGTGAAALRIAGPSAVLSGVRVSDSSRMGIWAESPVEILDSVIERCGESGIRAGQGARIVGNRIEGNEVGIDLESGAPEIADNEILSNRGWGIAAGSGLDAMPPITGNRIVGNERLASLPPNAVPGPDDDNVLGPNTLNALFITGGALTHDLSLGVVTGEGYELRTYVLLYGSLQVALGRRLTIGPDVAMKLLGSAIEVSGELRAVGTAQSPVVFTSYNDDEVGGDTGLDGHTLQPRGADWFALYFAPEAAAGDSLLEHAVVRFAEIGVNTSGSRVTVRDSVFTQNYTALFSTNATNVLENNQVFANEVRGYLFEGSGAQQIHGGRIYANRSDGISFYGTASGRVEGVELFANRTALRSESSGDVDARGSWWGSADGPSGAGYSGTGGRIERAGTGAVLVSDLFQGFLTTGTPFSDFDAGGSAHSGFGIPTPIVSGTASTIWGSEPETSILFDQSAQPRVTAEYQGLTSGAPHLGIVTYLNQDPDGATQTLHDGFARELHGPFALSSGPQYVAVPVPVASVDQGSLSLRFEAAPGQRASLATLTLVQAGGAADAVPPTIALTAPASGVLLPAGTHEISGTASDSGSGLQGVEVSIEAPGAPAVWRAVTELSLGGAWRYAWLSPASGAYAIQARATDRAGNRTLAPTIVTVSVDSVAPAAPTELVIESAPGGLIRSLWLRSADDGAGANDVAHYQILRRPDRTSAPVVVAQLGPGAQSYDDSGLTAGVGYFYRVRAVDAAGNYGETAEIGPRSTSEVADVTPPEDVTGLTGAATSVGGAQISARLSWTQSANSAGDLIAQRVYVGRTGSGTVGTNVPAFNNGLPFTLARAASSFQIIGLQANVSLTFRITTIDEVPNESAGVSVVVVPTGAPSQVITLPTTLPTGTYELLTGVYRVTSNVTVPVGSVLRLGAGAIVKFNSGASLLVDGRVEALGSGSAPVVFTALADDSYGGDTDANGASTGFAGAWGQLYFRLSSSGRLEHSVVRFAGGASPVAAAVRSDRAALEILFANVREGSGHGISITAGSARIEDSLIESHTLNGVDLNRFSTFVLGGPFALRRNTIIATQNGIDTDFLPVAIEGNTITGSGEYGVLYENPVGSAPKLTGNTITGNQIALAVPADALPDGTNILVPNTERYLEIRGGTFSGVDERLRVFARGEPGEVRTYVLCQFPRVGFGTLTVERGVVAKFCYGSSLTVSGTLRTEGTAAEPVVFTSVNDQTQGAVIGYDYGIFAQNGYWNGIQMFGNGGAPSLLQHTRVTYGGGQTSGAGLAIYGAQVRIEESEFSNSSGPGILVSNAFPTITASRIWGNDQEGIRVTDFGGGTYTFNRISTNGSHALNVTQMNPEAPVVATGNQIFGNRGAGLVNADTGTIDAANNWWGDFDASGPFAPDNGAGSGQEVTGGVSYAPFVTTPPLDLSYADFRESGVATQGNLPAPTLLQGTLSDEWDPVGHAPDRTAAFDPDRVRVHWSGLSSAKNYRVRTSYFTTVEQPRQSLRTSGGAQLHPPVYMPYDRAVQYEFLIPQAQYASGELTLEFVHESAPDTTRAAVTETWLMEDAGDLAPPHLDRVTWNDRDGSHSPTPGDEYAFTFSEPMDTASLVDGTTHGNDRLPPAGGRSYGAVNAIQWSADARTVTVTVTAGVTLLGGELVTPAGPRDLQGNLAVGSVNLPVVDQVAPHFVGIDWLDRDLSGALSVGDGYVFRFDEVMDTAGIQSGAGSDANTKLRPVFGRRYGNTPVVTWAADARSVTVDVTSGYTIFGDEEVFPSAFVGDAAGNSVLGTRFLSGRDVTAPVLLGIRFDDSDGNGATSVGDRYLFRFNEPMDQSTLFGNGPNALLSPAGASYGGLLGGQWDALGMQYTLPLAAGFTVLGNELVTPSPELTDLSQNPISSAAQPLTLLDDVPPTVVQAHGNAASPVPQTSDYRVTVQFSTTMKSFLSPLVTVLADGGAQPTVPATGTWTTTAFPNDTYTTDGFTVDRTSLGQLHASVSGGEDVAGNPAVPLPNAYAFTVQAAPPTVTSHPLAPAITNLTTSAVVIAGTRDVPGSIRINGVQRAALASGPWSASLSLSQGSNDLEIHAVNAAGESSESVHVLFFVDSIAPQFTGSVPSANAFVNVRPALLQVLVSEPGSGVNLAASTFTLTRGGSAVGGQWSLAPEGVVFTPSAAFVDGAYSWSVRLRDNFNLQSSLFAGTFTVDTVAPAAPTLNAVPAVIAINSVTTAGTKEAFAAILRNGQVVVSNTSSTSWSVATPLTPGANSFSFVARDRALNLSPAVTADVTYDNAAPGAVPITIQGAGNGTNAVLGWQSYDEFANGNDIDHYTVYISSSPFANASAATAIATVAHGTKTYTATGLLLGQTVHFAVVAQDTAGNQNLAVTSVAVTPADAAPPEDVTNLRVGSYADHLFLEWNPSADTIGDLATYRVYVDAQAPVTLPKTATSYDVTPLSPATSHTLRITALDSSNHESAGVTKTGATWLANPAGVVATPLNARVDLTWSAAAPGALVKNYRVYMSTSPIASVAGMTPQLTLAPSKLTAGVTGLANGTLYYFAVTTLNTSDGERPDVLSVSATPQPDTAGPTLTGATLAGTPLADGRVVGAAATVAVTATDPSGVSRVEFSATGAAGTTQIGVDANASGGYTALWDVAAAADGPYTLTLHAFDTLGNESTQSYAVTVTLAAPAVPAIAAPANGKRTNQTSIAVSGTGTKDTQVQLYRAGAALGGLVTVGFDGKWSTTASLVDGANAISATARNRSGESPASAAVTITLDRTIPGAPIGVTAEARPGGEIRLNWTAANDGQRVTYDLYRSTASFDDPALATKVNSAHIGTWPFSDIPTSDGKYFYRVVAVNDVGTASPPSNLASATADSVAPHALSITYQTTGPYDPATGRFAPGAVSAQVAVSEPLQTTPFLSIAPSGGVPIAIALRKVGDTSYVGDFEITPFTKSGTAFAVFSARDRVGNRGTDVDAGATLAIDTVGPIVTSLTTAPTHPIRNDQASPVEVLVTLQLSERTGGGATPQLDYTLSASAPTPTAIPSIQSASADGLTWEAIFSLPSGAGLAAAESLRFAFRAADDLGNVSTEIQGTNLFQVYQGDLPPAGVPTGLTAVPKPGGAVELAWNAVDEAVAYQLYRKGPNAAAGDPLVALGSRLTALTFTDATTQDGVYAYAVASVRSVNGQETVSAQSAPVLANADATRPLAPQSLALSLTSRGIAAQWAPPLGGVLENGVVTYAVYRDATPLGQNLQIAGLTPIQGNIAGLAYLDPHPSPSQHAYAVVAIDAAGNVSLPSNTAYLNFNLLPVATLTIDQVDAQPPLVRWTYPNVTVASYRLRLGSGADAIVLQDSSAKSYSDAGYDGGERSYNVAAVDAGGAESLARSLLLPVLSASLAEDARVERGVFTRLDYAVRNGGTTSVTGVRVRTEIHGHSGLSEPFDIAGGETRTVPVVVGGFPDLAATEPVRTTLEWKPNEGEVVSIARTANVAVVDSTLLATVETEDLVRGATGRVRFRLENTSAVETEVVVAEQNGTKPSNEARFLLLDADENVLSALPVTQFSGAGVVSLSNKRTVARVPAGEAFTSAWHNLPVPVSAPDGVSVSVVFDLFHYKLGADEHVAIPGNGGRSAAALAETSYFGELLSISPTSSFGDQDVIITGRAVDRVTQLPLPSAALTVVVRVKGFERKFSVQTEADGHFELHYPPTASESGIYAVSVLHPARLDRPTQGEFTIGSIAAAPTHFNVRVPKNFEATLPIKVTAGDGTSATNVRLEYLAADQIGGVFPAGIAVTLPAPISLASRDAVTLNAKLSADNNAASTASLHLRLLSDATGPDPIAMIDLDCSFSDAQPALFFAPTVVQTGVVWNGSVQASVRLENRGLAPLLGVRTSLLEQASNSPAPGWVYLTSAQDIGRLEVGQTVDVGLAAQPTNAVPEGYHEFRLRIASDNYPTRDIPVVVSVLQNGIGSVIFHASDIYTATLDTSGQPIQGLAGARLKIEHEDVLNITRNGFTDSLGEIQFSDLPAGRYRFRASAPDHEDVAGRFRILPGVTAAEEVFLVNALITVEWSVEETTIQDRYEIKLNATFKTDVPVPVVVLDPASVALPDLRKGDVFYGELTLTNHGLVRAGEVTAILPKPDAFVRYELLAPIPDTLDAKQRVVIPYRAIAIGSLDPSADAAGTGGGSCSYQQAMCVSHREPCANGTMFSGRTCTGWVNSQRCGGGTAGGSQSTTGGGGGGNVSWSGPGGGGPVGVPVVPKGRVTEGVKCAPQGCDPGNCKP